MIKIPTSYNYKTFLICLALIFFVNCGSSEASEFNFDNGVLGAWSIGGYGSGECVDCYYDIDPNYSNNSLYGIKISSRYSSSWMDYYGIYTYLDMDALKLEFDYYLEGEGIAVPYLVVRVNNYVHNDDHVFMADDKDGWKHGYIDMTPYYGTYVLLEIFLLNTYGSKTESVMLDNIFNGEFIPSVSSINFNPEGPYNTTPENFDYTNPENASRECSPYFYISRTDTILGANSTIYGFGGWLYPAAGGDQDDNLDDRWKADLPIYDQTIQYSIYIFQNTGYDPDHPGYCAPSYYQPCGNDCPAVSVYPPFDYAAVDAYDSVEVSYYGEVPIPLPTLIPTPSFTPVPTPTPFDGEDPQNNSINSSWSGDYYDYVDDSMSGYSDNLMNISDFLNRPIDDFTAGIGNVTDQFNENSNYTHHKFILLEIIPPVLSAIPDKLKAIITLGFVFMLILIVLGRDR